MFCGCGEPLTKVDQCTSYTTWMSIVLVFSRLMGCGAFHTCSATAEFSTILLLQASNAPPFCLLISWLSRLCRPGASYVSSLVHDCGSLPQWVWCPSPLSASSQVSNQIWKLPSSSTLNTPCQMYLANAYYILNLADITKVVSVLSLLVLLPDSLLHSVRGGGGGGSTRKIW